MRSFGMCWVGLLAAMATGCAANVSEGELLAEGADGYEAALNADEGKPLDGYYTARRDTASCAFPLCGGYWVKDANGGDTLCPDGSLADECYVAALQLPQGIRVGALDLLHGELVSRDVDGQHEPIAALEVDVAYKPTVAPNAESDASFLLVRDSKAGIGGSWRWATMLNGVRSWLVARIQMAGDERTASRLSDAFDAEMADEEAPGALVFGARSYGFLPTLSVENVFVPRVAARPVCVLNVEPGTTTAWNFSDERAGWNLADYLGDTATVLYGTCASQRFACPEIYEPVHGTIDAAGAVCQEAANFCEFSEMVAHAAGTTSKAKGSYEDGVCAPEGAGVGEFCGGIAGIVCADGLTCRLESADADAGGTCVQR